MSKASSQARRVLCAGASLLLLACSPPESEAQQEDMTWIEYAPRSTLVVPETPTPSARFPFVDVHSHHRMPMGQDRMTGVLAAMDAMNMGVLVNLSGGSGAGLAQAVAEAEALAPGRVVLFANLDFSGIDEPGWSERTAAQFEADVRAGARGLKIFKNLGMTVRDSDGARVSVDDPRIDAVWAKAGELGVPVLIHSADPAQFWEPHDRFNERWYELVERPNRKRDAAVHGSWEEIIAEQHNVFRKHPGTNFIAAHLGWYGNDLQRLGALLDAMPNVYTAFGAVIAELGRQPRFARAWMTQYQDRILFGKDSWAPDEYPTYFQTLETDDDYVEYFRRRHAFWRIYGIDLPEEVLRRIYYQNALDIIPGLDRSLFPSS